MSRTTASAVESVLAAGGDYDEERRPSLMPFIDTAAAITSRVQQCAARKGKALTLEELELVERWLAAHAYAQSDKPYTSKSTEGASASFSGQTGMGLDSTLYGQMALRVDPSGCLAAIDKRQQAGGFWLGRQARDQRAHWER